METTNLVLAGVGGQGILLAAEIIAKAAMLSGYDVKTNEIHGMAQRGGSVIAQIRFGEKVYSPLIAEGTADVLCAFEQMESIRYGHYLSEKGIAIVSDQAIIPVTVSSGKAHYPHDIKNRLDNIFKNLVYLNSVEIAEKLGNIKVTNIILIGALSNHLNISEDIWKQAIETCVKPKFIALNLKAFAEGKKIGNN